MQLSHKNGTFLYEIRLGTVENLNDLVVKLLYHIYIYI